MPKNLDIAALRSLVAIADSGSVTSAATQMHLTQSAVSMQIKRLEQQFDVELLRRRGRGVVLTEVGEQLLSYARRMIALNDETWARLTNDDFEGEVTFGIPVDIMDPEVPEILKRCKQLYPRVHINLISSLTNDLLKRFKANKIDIILTTEHGRSEQGETLAVETNDWFGAVGGSAYLKRPLPLSMCRQCAMRPAVLKALDDANLPWITIGDTDSEVAVDTMLSADLSVSAKLRGSSPHYERLPDGVLPRLPDVMINLYSRPRGDKRIIEHVTEIVRQVFAQRARAA